MEIKGPQPEFVFIALPLIVKEWAKGIYTGIVELFVMTIVDKWPKRKDPTLPAPNPEGRKKQQQTHVYEKDLTSHPQQQQEPTKIKFIINARYYQEPK
jgi:hypothetical protein